MSMSVNLHLRIGEVPTIEGHVRVASDNSVYAVFNIETEGANSNEVTMFLNLEQVQAIKKEITKLERNLKKKLNVEEIEKVL